jgi:hypothetical protein
MAVALENIDLDQPIGDTQLREREPRLVAVSRTLHRVERKHWARFPGTDHAVIPVLRREGGNVMAGGPSGRGFDVARQVPGGLMLRVERGDPKNAADVRVEPALTLA